MAVDQTKDFLTFLLRLSLRRSTAPHIALIWRGGLGRQFKTLTPLSSKKDSNLYSSRMGSNECRDLDTLLIFLLSYFR